MDKAPFRNGHVQERASVWATGLMAVERKAVGCS